MDERSDHEVAVVGVDALHDVPRRGVGTRPANRLLSDGSHTVVPSKSSPLPLGDPPTRQRILLECLQAFSLRRGIQIEKAVQNDRIVVGQCLLEERDLLESTREGGLATPSLEPVPLGRLIPRVDQEPDPAAGR